MANNYQKFSRNGWRGVVLESTKDEVDLSNLEEWAQAKTTKVVRTLPLRTISLFQRESGDNWYFKVLRGLGDATEGFLNSMKWRFRPSRFLKVLKISQELQQAGFLCPRIILAARKRSWWPFGHPTDFMIQEASPGRVVSYYLSGEDGNPRLEGQERVEMLKRMGSELARLHLAGFVHGDCHPGNYFWQEGSNSFCYIDNDRTARYASMNISGAIRNLISAGFYLLHRNRVSSNEWETILDAYLQKSGFSPKKAKTFRHSVTSGIQARLAKDK